jgi:hypothetical protein
MSKPDDGPPVPTEATEQGVYKDRHRNTLQTSTDIDDVYTRADGATEGEGGQATAMVMERESPTKQKTSTRGRSPGKTPHKVTTSRSLSKHRYPTSSQRVQGKGNPRKKQAMEPNQTLTRAFATMATDAAGRLFGPTDTVEVKKEIMEYNDNIISSRAQDMEEDEEIQFLGTSTNERQADDLNTSDDESMDEQEAPEATPPSITDENERRMNERGSSPPDQTQPTQQTHEQPDAEEANPKQQAPAVHNPYKKKRPLEIATVLPEEPEDTNNREQQTHEKDKTGTYEEDEEDTPKANGAKTSYASATQQTQIRTHEQLKLKYSMYAEAAFNVDRECNRLPTRVTDAIIREVIIHLIKRGKYVDNKFAINPYFAGTNLPTIRKPEDVPWNTQALKAYLPHQYQRTTKLRQGRNGGFRINATFTIPPAEFLHLWEASRKEHAKIPYITLKKTPMQDSEIYFTVGYFINSSEKQCIDQLREGLAQEANMKIGMDFKPAALDKASLDQFWRAAKEKAGGNSREMFKRAPLVMQAYAASREMARDAADQFYKSYGRQTAEGSYPRMPDGSRMRFVPAAHFLDMKSRPTARGMMTRQIWMQSNTVNAPIPIADPFQRFEAHGNKTMNELLLDLQCKEKDDEPYFRHLTRKWTREYSNDQFEVAINTNMYAEAAKILRKLPEVLTQTYSKEVADALHTLRDDEMEELRSYQTASVITLDTDDRYMNGKGTFIFEGLEQIEPKNNTREKSDERSMNVRSEVTGLSDIQTIGSDNTSNHGTLEKQNEPVDMEITSTKAGVPTNSDEGFTRVGTVIDEERLRDKVRSSQDHDPGKGSRSRYP